MIDGTFAALRDQLTQAAETFAEAPDTVSEILTGIVDDVDRGMAERLEIFPVCHHSPASALAMARRLRQKQPKVIYLELCEDLRPLLTELRNCRLPVALQAFAGEIEGFPPDWGPLSVVAPITEASAEYQAIAYALDTPGVELVLVDRSADHVFQWLPRDDSEETTEPEAGGGDPDEDAGMHGDAVGVEIGDLRPRFRELEGHLLHHGKVRHWSEWWDLYVEQPLAGADYATYRQVMMLIGSLFRRLTPVGDRRLRTDEDRERYMWTRIREHFGKAGVEADDCMYVCGAAHAASRVEQFGLDSTAGFDITPPSGSNWLYGLIPSSHSSIEAQFGLAGGSVSIAAASWEKALKASGLTPFRLSGQKGGKPRKVKPVPADPVSGDANRLSGFLSTPPATRELDEAELLAWSVDIVRLARKNGYLSSTADAIAVFETSILLAGMRNRARPTPYDFQDAAVTCIEKDTVPGRRDVRRLCEILLGGDRVGQVGYEALPPLAQDVYDRLKPLGIDLRKRTVQRVLIDLSAEPQKRQGSRLLWTLRHLLPSDSVRPIMGVKKLGEESLQESWDVSIGSRQRDLIELGYEGVTVEQVLEQRLRRKVWSPDATAAIALRAVEDSILYLGSRRFTNELGARAIDLLKAERTVDDAPEVLRRIRALVAYYRSVDPKLPEWAETFVTTGYAHYCTLLPTAFTDEQTGLRQVGAMLGFLFTMESVAIALGCDRTQLELAVKQSHPETPAKLALRWAAQFQLSQLPMSGLRERCDDLLGNPLVLPSFPQYLSGFIQALDPVPTLTPFVVELLSKAFGRLPDTVLLPWLPNLITTLRANAAELVPVLVREAGRTFPGNLAGVDTWTPPWSIPDTPREAVTVAPSGPVTELAVRHSTAAQAIAAALGHDPAMPEFTPGAAGGSADAAPEVAALVARHPDSATATAAVLGVAG
ncbi:hypothetical protein LX16_4961 [Stackebrandtia albiflava]|uniref:Uncharacterized protein n=1 Tax=Stackebrandtia albiflava TaxID=406432 RepID=A0A562UQC5_9ACTN|nr:DUF5682 family protein [Stackebrandtia albiflava]TWJ07797.1 hypothetical protein LX16_4961 [Stackebrandtia albiflava]